MEHKKSKKHLTFCTEEEVIVKLKAASLYDKYNNLRLSGKQLFMDFCTGKSLRALTYDAIFKKIFSYEQHPARLEHFLFAILGYKLYLQSTSPLTNLRKCQKI